MDTEKADMDSAHGADGDSGEAMASLFQPDVLANDLYLESFRRGALFEPEKHLMAAILEDAIETIGPLRAVRSSGYLRRPKRGFLATIPTGFSPLFRCAALSVWIPTICEKALVAGVILVVPGA
jgi:hypothetical protein